MTKASNEDLLLICDLNVFVMAYIFDSTTMLSDTPYSFGKVFIHQTVYDELALWITSEAKKKKFGIELIKTMLELCGRMVIDKPVLAEQEEQKLFSRITRVERALSAEQVSSDTSRSDKTYLSLAMKLSANLVTQEKTLRNISLKTIGEKRLFSFTDMIADRFNSGGISKEKVEEGLSNLKHYEENLLSGGEKAIISLINK